MKKLLSILLAAIMLVSCMAILTSCDGNDDPSAESGNSGSGVADVHVFYYNYGDAYIASVRGVLDQQLADAGITYQDYDGNNNQTTQTEQVQTAITKGAKLLVVNIVNTGSDDAATGIIDLAKNADIPVVFFNREVSTEVINSYEKSAFVGTDAPEAGHLQGQMIGEYLVENFDTVDLNGDGKISYILFKGEEGNPEANYRTQYAVEDANTILTEAGLEALSFYDANNTDGFLLDKNGAWSAAAANEYMTTALASYNDQNGNMIEMVIANNDNMCEGAITALNTVGYNTGSGNTIPVFGVDATQAAQALIAQGKMTGTIKQDAEGMAAAIVALTQNGLAGNDLMDGTDSYIVDSDSDKIRIPYQIYLGEDSAATEGATE